MISYRIKEDTFVGILFSTEIHVGNKLIVLVSMILVIVGDKIAEVDELVRICDEIRIVFGTCTACEISCNRSIPSIYRIGNERNL